MTKKKPGRTEVEFLSRTLHLYGVRHTVEVPAGPGAEAELDRACQETVRQVENERVGARVRNAHGEGRPLTISDEALATRWLAVRRDPWLKVAGVSQEVSEALAREGITLSPDRITKRVRPYLQKRGEWS